ncbi:MAG: AAA family ATPase [Cuniculiplasma divulgatum]|jgi:predicted ATPase|nr:MAG: AAA family ATPase [Cuniculiplasma divulgatum]
MIKKVRAINFKSFESLDIDLSDLNVIIGQNSAGKSNFVSIFQFIRDIATVGLSNAISLQGGLEYLLNYRNSAEGHLDVEIQLDIKHYISLNGPQTVRLSDFSYKLQLYPFKRKKGIQKYIEEVSLRTSRTKGDTNETGTIKFFLQNGKISSEGEEKIIKQIMPFPTSFSKDMGSLMQIPPLSFFLGFGMDHLIQVYDFDPKLSKKAIPITGKAELEPDGSNTALVLKKMLAHPDERKKFIQYLKVCLPFVKDVSIENQVDKSVIFKMLETYNSKTYIPAPIISDGTIEIVSIIYSLFFERKELIVIEEPERNIHPRLISNLMSLVKEASQKKQIIITTHSPEMIKYVDLENLYVIDRDQYGASKISRASNNDEIKAFLKEKIGIDELFVDGILN